MKANLVVRVDKDKCKIVDAIICAKHATEQIAAQWLNTRADHENIQIVENVHVHFTCEIVPERDHVAQAEHDADPDNRRGH